jgi:hypothetical protein
MAATEVHIDFISSSKNSFKILIPTVLCLLYGFLSLKKDVNVPYLEKVISNKKFFLSS